MGVMFVPRTLFNNNTWNGNEIRENASTTVAFEKKGPAYVSSQVFIALIA